MLAIWNSAKGYSRPQEIVRIIRFLDAEMFLIESDPDDGEGNVPFSYCVPASEITLCIRGTEK